VVNDELTSGVEADVELHAVRTLFDRSPEGIQRVLGKVCRRPTVGVDERSAALGHLGETFPLHGEWSAVA
jgi:hypothetical protein